MIEVILDSIMEEPAAEIELEEEIELTEGIVSPAQQEAQEAINLMRQISKSSIVPRGRALSRGSTRGRSKSRDSSDSVLGNQPRAISDTNVLVGPSPIRGRSATSDTVRGRPRIVLSDDQRVALLASLEEEDPVTRGRPPVTRGRSPMPKSKPPQRSRYADAPAAEEKTTPPPRPPRGFGSDTPRSIVEVKTEPKKDLIVPEEKDPEIDFETGRKNLYNLLDKGNEAIDGILNLAKEGEHPRAYEVAGQLIKTVSEVSQNLLDLQDKLKKVKEVPNTGPKNVTNALFVGSTTELQKMLKKSK